MKSPDIDRDDLRARYLEGVSEQALAKLHGVGRRVIRRNLLAAGVEPRGRGAAMSVRMGRATPEERKVWAAAANEARRTRPMSDREAEARARTREERLTEACPHEFMLAQMLRDRGVETTPQLAVGRYNIDLSVGGRVAVELHRAPGNPARHATTRKRAHYLLDQGWSVIYVWCSYSHVLSGGGADEVVAFAKLAERLPAGVRQYRVVRGTGEPVADVRFDRDEAAVIPAPVSHSRVVMRRH